MLATYPRSLYLTGSLLALSMAATALPGLLVPGFYEPFLTRYGLAYAQVFMQDLATVLLLPLLAWSMLAEPRRAASPSGAASVSTRSTTTPSTASTSSTRRSIPSTWR
ncbi:MAG TPA: hypothetical protein P5165_04375 [Spirochaetia bacterium]|nr:hypothetical protein [Spirochaetia bacterium]